MMHVERQKPEHKYIPVGKSLEIYRQIMELGKFLQQLEKVNLKQLPKPVNGQPKK